MKTAPHLTDPRLRNDINAPINKYEEVAVEKVDVGAACYEKLFVGDVINAVVIDGVRYEITRTYNVIDVMLTARTTSSVVFVIERNGVEMEVSVDMSTVALTAA